MTALSEPPADCYEPELLCAADYPAEPVKWLWPGRISIGKVTLLVGDPGNGKSLVALDVAARVTRGGPWPDVPPSSLPLSPAPGSVVILSAEDDLSDTIRPRLDAAGADPSRIFVLPHVADLRHDLPKLRAALDRIPDCRLIIIDPVNAFVGPGDSHFHTVVRRVFKPLADLATERGIAILGITHLRKHDGTAIQRAVGSMGFVAAARAVWTVCKDPATPDRHLLLSLKNNFVADAPGLSYSIVGPEPSNFGKGGAPAITWHSDKVTTDADHAMQPREKITRDELGELHMAREYLREELANGPLPAIFVVGEAEMYGGFHERTLRRALVSLGGRSRKTSPRGEWVWSLPEHDPANIAETDPEPTPNSESTGDLRDRVEPCPLGENKHLSGPELVRYWSDPRWSVSEPPPLPKPYRPRFPPEPIEWTPPPLQLYSFVDGPLAPLARQSLKSPHDRIQAFKRLRSAGPRAVRSPEDQSRRFTIFRVYSKTCGYKERRRPIPESVYASPLSSVRPPSESYERLGAGRRMKTGP